MSPRAAWQLEAMGFSDVYDFVDGKIEWISHGLPVEGHGPHYPVAGEVADRATVLTCRLGDRVGEVAHLLASQAHDYCVVLNEHDIVLGLMREKDVRGSTDAAVEEVMEPGPTTVRPHEAAARLLERMKKRNVPAVIVTTSKGGLVGAATQEALKKLVTRSR
ncbi:hypothetical protein BH20ACT22_BH20ACT22_23010 [soil metagenome]